MISSDSLYIAERTHKVAGVVGRSRATRYLHFQARGPSEVDRQQFGFGWQQDGWKDGQLPRRRRRQEMKGSKTRNIARHARWQLTVIGGMEFEALSEDCRRTVCSGMACATRQLQRRNERLLKFYLPTFATVLSLSGSHQIVEQAHITWKSPWRRPISENGEDQPDFPN
jgi:hypothetical protein